MGRNVFAGLTASLWSAMIALVMVPFYLKYLGVEAYGLIGFFASLQAIMTLLDMGISPTINREVARYAAAGNLSEVSDLLHTVAVIYWIMAILIALTILIFAPLIGENWIKSSQLDRDVVKKAVALIGLVIAARWPVGLYQGVLFGVEKIVLSSVITAVAVSAGALGAALIIGMVSPTIEAFFLWQAFVGVVYALAMREAAWRAVGGSASKKVNVQTLTRVWRFAVGMTGVAATGLLFTQMDKIILSKIVSLEHFAHYMLATALVSGLYLISVPVFNAAYPRMSSFVASGSDNQVANTYHSASRVLASVILPLSMLLIIFSEFIVYHWTGDAALAAAVGPIVSILSAGTALHALMYAPYALQLAYGRTSLPLRINLCLLVFQLPLTIWAARSFGALGGAIAWVLLHSGYLTLGIIMTHRELLRGHLRRWLISDIGVSLFFSSIAAILVYKLVLNHSLSSWQQFVLGSAIFVMAIFVSLFCDGHLRKILLSELQRVTRKS